MPKIPPIITPNDAIPKDLTFDGSEELLVTLRYLDWMNVLGCLTFVRGRLHALQSHQQEEVLEALQKEIDTQLHEGIAVLGRVGH